MQVSKHSIEKVRQDIKDYEHHKNMRRLSTATTLGGAALALGAGIANHKPIAGLGLGTAFASGFARGRAKREEHAALNRIKSFYDLRKHEAATEDGQEKQAVLGGILESISAVADMLPMVDWDSATHALSHTLENVQNLPLIGQYLPHIGVSHDVAVGAAAMAPTAVDIATLPTVAKIQGQRIRDAAYAGAKDMRGKHPLTPQETINRGKSIRWLGKDRAVDSMPDSAWKKFKQKAVQPYYKIFGQGAQYGEYAGQALRQIDKHSDKWGDLVENAIKDDAGWKKLKETALSDFEVHKKTFEEANSIIDEIPGGRKFQRLLGSRGDDILREGLDHPEKLLKRVRGIKRGVGNVVRGSRYGLGALALAGLGHMAGGYRKRHPLAEDTLPKKITAPEVESRTVSPALAGYRLPKPGKL